jgi:hypothetical protein
MVAKRGSDEHRGITGAMISRVRGAKLLAFVPRTVLLAKRWSPPARPSRGELQPYVGHRKNIQFTNIASRDNNIPDNLPRNVPS